MGVELVEVCSRVIQSSYTVELWSNWQDGNRTTIRHRDGNWQWPSENSSEFRVRFAIKSHQIVSSLIAHWNPRLKQIFIFANGAGERVAGGSLEDRWRITSRVAGRSLVESLGKTLDRSWIVAGRILIESLDRRWIVTGGSLRESLEGCWKPCPGDPQ